MVVGNDAKIMGEETHPKWVSGFGWLSVVSCPWRFLLRSSSLASQIIGDHNAAHKN